MTEIKSVPAKFTTIQFTTKDGEKCTATKKNGIVTVVGDKNGIRQVPFDDFMKDFVEILPKVDLVKTPAKDTVQFSGAENPVQKTQEKETKTPEKELTPEEDKSVAINKKNLTIGGAITLIAMAGLYVFGRGRWWSKAAQNLERKGQDLVNDLADNVTHKSPEEIAEEFIRDFEKLYGRKIGEQASEPWKRACIVDVEGLLKLGKVNEDGTVVLLQVNEEMPLAKYYLTKGKNPKIVAMDDLWNSKDNETVRRIFYAEDGKPFSYSDVAKDTPIPEAPLNKQLQETQQAATQKVDENIAKAEGTPSETLKPEPPKQPESITPTAENIEGAERNILRPTSPIPESEMFVIPKDLETDVEKIIQNGRCDNTPLIMDGKQVYGYTLETSEGFSRVYYITDDNVIMGMNEFAKNNIIPFRIFNFEHGQVRSITDNTKLTINKKFFSVEKPKTETPKVEQPKVEDAVNSNKTVSVEEWRAIHPIHPRPAVPIDQIFEIPKDLELNLEKVLKSDGIMQKFSDGKKLATIQTSNPDIRRVYTISPENEILYIEEFGAEEILPTRAFRRFKIKNGHVSEIINKTEDGFPTRYIGNEYTGTLKRVNPPKLAGADIERTGAFEIPTDIEFNVKTIMAIGDKEHTVKWLAFGKKQVTLNLPNGITRRYSLDAKNNITMIVETKGDKERWISFKEGKPVSITAEGSVMELTPEEQDLIMVNKKELPNILKKKPAKKQQTVVAEQPKQKVEPQKEPEPTLVRTSQQQDDLLRQEQELARKNQEAVDRANEDIINAAVIADISTQGAKKGIKPVAESLNPENVVRPAEDAADNLFGLHPERVGEDFTAYNPAGTVDTFEPRIDFEMPKIGDDVDGLNNLGIDNLDNGMPHIGEPDIFSDFGGGFFG